MRTRYILLSLLVCFILGVSMVIPVFDNRRSIIDVLYGRLNGEGLSVVGDDNPIVDGTVVTGLQFEDIDIYWTSTGAILSNNYTDINLTAKQIFVPDELSDKTEHFTYYLQEWHEDQARFWVTLTYLQYTHVDYDDLNLNNLLGNLPQQEPVNLSSAVNFTIWNGANSVLYNVGDIVFYDDEYYLCKQQIYNYNGFPPSLPQHWEITEESEGSIYPSDRFQISNKEVWATNKTDKGYVCEITDFTDVETGFNVSWGISVHSYYYHVIVDYNLYFTNYTDINGTLTENNYLVYTWQNVYSGDKPDLLPIDYNVEKLALNRTMINYVQHADFVDRATLKYDNLYGEGHSVNVTIAYPINSSDDFKNFYADDVWFEYPDDLYDDIVTSANNIGKTETLLDNPEDYLFRSYLVNVSSDNVETFYFDIDSDAKTISRMHMWVNINPWGSGGGAPDSWGDSDWTYRKKITLNSSQISSTQTNFPVLINITDTDLRDNALSNGSDILFTNVTGTQLNHEIELWTNTTGKLVAWVNVTELKHDEDTVIYMYYGNSESENQQNVADTWDSHYNAVWHYTDVTTSSIGDVSGNSHSGTKKGANEPIEATGIIYKGQDYDGDNDYIKVNTLDRSSLFNQNLTWSGWIYPNLSSKIFSLFQQGLVKTQNKHYGISLYVNTKYEIIFTRNQGSTTSYHVETDAIISLNNWQYITVTYNKADGSTVLYLNGTSVASDTFGTGNVAYHGTYEKGFYLGATIRGVSPGYSDGLHDEFRFFNTIKSANWIKTEYNNQVNATDGGFFTLGSEETESEWQNVSSGWFTFDTTDRTFQTIQTGWFNFNTSDRTYNTIDSGWFSFNTESRNFQIVDSGWFTFDTTDRAIQQIQIGWFNFNTDDREFQTVQSGWFTFDTTDRAVQTIDSGYFTFDTADRSFTTVESGYFTFNTTDRTFQTIDAGWFNFNTSDRSIQTISTGWFNFNTMDRTYITIQPGYFIFNTTNRAFQQLQTGYFTFNTSDRTLQTITQGWFNFDIISKDYKTIQSGWFTFDIVDRSFTTIDSGYFTFDTESRNVLLVESGWFTFNTNDRSIQTITTGYFTFNTVTKTHKNIQSGWFNFDTEDRTHTTIDSGYFTFNTTDRNIQTIDVGWFNFTTPDRTTNIQTGWFTFDTASFIYKTVQSGWFTFDTEIMVVNITITYNYPIDNSRNIQLQPVIYATINHSLSRIMNMTIYYSTNQTNINTFLTTYNNITNSTQYTTLYPANTRSTTYYWRIQANDGTNTQNFTYQFQTEGYPGGGTGGIITTNVYGIIAIVFSILGIMALLIIWIKKRGE